MYNGIRWQLVSAMVLSVYCQLSVLGGSVRSNNLEVSVDVHPDTICICSPVVIRFCVKNISSAPVEVTIPRLGSMDVYEKTVLVRIETPAREKVDIIYAEPFLGPVREMEGGGVTKSTMIQPNHELTSFLVIGGSWGEKSYAIFSQQGDYFVLLTYYPFVVTDARGRLKVDRSHAIQLPALRITVLRRDIDVAAWEEIRKFKDWWILYDPEMRNVKYLMGDERQQVKDELLRLAKAVGESSFCKILEYCWGAIHVVCSGEHGDILPEEVVKSLDSLANDRDFVYQKYAEEMSKKLKK